MAATPPQPAPCSPARDRGGRARPPAPRRFAAALALLAALGAGAPRARAQGAAPARVGVLFAGGDGGTADPLLTELVTRVQGELRAAGFDPVAAPRPTLDDPRAAVEAPGAPGWRAAFAVVHDRARGVVEVWLSDRRAGRTVVRSLPAGETRAANASSRLAVRGVELLRASLLELRALDAPAAPAAPAAVVAAAAPAPPPAPAARRSLGLGLGVLGGGGLALLPAVVLGLRPRPRLGVRFGAHGLGTRPAVDAPAGRARVGQTLLLAAIDGRLSLGPRAAVVASLGGGALRAAIDGAATAPYVPHRRVSWSGAATAGLGLETRVAGPLSLSLEAVALFALPPPSVRIAGVEVARLGRPSLLSGAHVHVSF